MLIAAAAGYLVFMTISHTLPFSPALQVELAVGGWLVLVSQIIIAFVTRPYYGRSWPWLPSVRRPRLSLRTLRGRWDLAVTGALFALLIGTAAAVGATGNVSNACNSAATCIKIDNWRAADGGYYRQYPYDAAGNGNPSTPFVRISRAEYVAEVGTLLRSAAFFGLVALTLGMAVNVMAEGSAARPSTDG